MTTSINPAHESEARGFLQEMLKEPVNGDLQEYLKSGVALCKLINALKPGTITKINTGKMPFVQMENIGAYIAACKKLGIPEHYLFVTVDLFEGKNMAQVILNINTVKREMGFGFDKTSKPEVKALDLGFEKEVTPVNVTVSKSPEPVTVSSDVKRVGNAFRAGQEELTEAKTCTVCNRPITSGCISACGTFWHTNCFTCKRCGVVKLADKKYFEHQNKPYCEKCIFILVPQQKIHAQTVDKGFQF